MLSGSGKMSYPLFLWIQEPRQKSLVVCYIHIPAQADKEVLSWDNKKGEVSLSHFPKSRQIMLAVSDW